MARSDRFRQELTNHFLQKREGLRRQWVRQMRANGLLQGLTPQEIEDESHALFDTYVKCLETGKNEAVLGWARFMARRGLRRGMTTEHLIEGLLVLYDVCRQSLSRKYQADTGRLAKALRSPGVLELMAVKTTLEKLGATRAALARRLA